LSLSAPELLTAQHVTTEFSCGQPTLDAWLKTRALRNQEHGFTRVLVVHDSLKIAAYYGLAPTAWIAADIPRAIRTGQSPDPVPCLLLAQLAVDLRHHGRGIGSGLLSDALRRCLTGASEIGGRAVVVRAIDGAAAAFYQHYGFTPSKASPLVLFRSISDVAASLAAAGMR
jgi:GNAT superfamily N-acetyltransferase